VGPLDRAADVAADVGVQSSVVGPVDRSDVEPVDSVNVLACSKFYKRQSETVQVASHHVTRGQRKAARPVRYDC